MNILGDKMIKEFEFDIEKINLNEMYVRGKLEVLV